MRPIVRQVKKAGRIYAGHICPTYNFTYVEPNDEIRTISTTPYALDCAAASLIRSKYALASSGREVKRSTSRFPSASTTFA